jgi:hypothetical protein
MLKYIPKIFVLAVAIAVFGLANLALAQQPMVQFETSPLFQDGDVKPCHTVTKWIKVTNTSGAIADASISAGNFADPLPAADLARAMMILIKEGSTNLYGPATLADFYKNGQTFLSQIADNATVQYDVTIYLTCEKGNEWQKKTTGFDLTVRLTGEGAPARGGVSALLTNDSGVGGGGNGPIAQSDAYGEWLSQQQNQSSQEIGAGSAIALAPESPLSIGQVLGESVFKPIGEVLSGTLAATGFSLKEFLLMIGSLLALIVLRLMLKRYSLVRN